MKRKVMIKKMLTPPTNLSKEPYLTEWHADLEGGLEVWIQTNEDEENPKWVRLGSLLEKVWQSNQFIPNGRVHSSDFTIDDLKDWING